MNRLQFFGWIKKGAAAIVAALLAKYLPKAKVDLPQIGFRVTSRVGIYLPDNWTMAVPQTYLDDEREFIPDNERRSMSEEYQPPKGYHLVKDWDTLTPQEMFARGDLTGGGKWTFGHPACFDDNGPIQKADLPMTERISRGYSEIWKALILQNEAAQRYGFSRKILKEMTKSATW